MPLLNESRKQEATKWTRITAFTRLKEPENLSTVYGCALRVPTPHTVAALNFSLNSQLSTFC